jgi:hypothetical protein
VITPVLSYAMIEVLTHATLLVAPMVNPASGPGCRPPAAVAPVPATAVMVRVYALAENAVGQANAVSAVAPSADKVATL